MINSEVLNDLLLYDPDTGKLFWRVRDVRYFKAERASKIWNTRYAGKEAMTTRTKCGHLSGRVFDKGYLAHRIIWCLHYGDWPDGELDHVNGVPFDNRLKNLRSVTSSENSKNTSIPKHNTSGFMGVYKETYTGKWVGSAESDGKRYKKRFDTIEQAILYRKQLDEKLGFHENHGRSKPK